MRHEEPLLPPLGRKGTFLILERTDVLRFVNTSDKQLQDLITSLTKQIASDNKQTTAAKKDLKDSGGKVCIFFILIYEFILSYFLFFLLPSLIILAVVRFFLTF